MSAVMSPPVLEMPLVELSGPPGARGEAHGEALRESVREHAARHLEWLLRGSAVKLTEQALLELWAPYVVANESAAPDLVEEMRGISRGADVPFEHIFLLNSLLDVGNLRFFDAARGMMGCTTFAVPNEAGTEQGIIGQTYDLAGFRKQFNTVLRISPEEGPRQLVYSFSGMIGAAGINDAGIGVVINYLSVNDIRPGKLHSVIVRQILAADNLPDALTSPAMSPRACGAHYLVADETGTCIGLETSGGRFEAIYPGSSPYGHTNHFLSPSMHEVEVIRESSIGGSLSRYSHLRRFFSERPALTREDVRALTRDHGGHPRSICQHGPPEAEDDLRGQTLSAMILCPGERTMEITHGCACEADYATLPV